jgi:hypothetical protein
MLTPEATETPIPLTGEVRPKIGPTAQTGTRAASDDAGRAGDGESMVPFVRPEHQAGCALRHRAGVLGVDADASDVGCACRHRATEPLAMGDAADISIRPKRGAIGADRQRPGRNA